ncbi:MAG: methenyltetrahydrofolate cyclohydrolase [Flavobacterium sp.]|nr:methenyltetrahydrofolate cyclohydrolase [Flavobacterium sp.]
MNLEKSLNSYFEELASNSPTPGGGNVSALCGALSASLGAMVCNLTIGKKKYVEVEAEMKEISAKLMDAQKEFFVLAEKDNRAFDLVMDAFKLPKETDEEKAARSAKIEEATIGAAQVPANVVKKCYEILPMIKTVVDKGNKNSLSDAGVASKLIAASAYGAYLNVLINCSSMTGNSTALELLSTSEELLSKINTVTDEISVGIVKILKV